MFFYKTQEKKEKSFQSVSVCGNLQRDEQKKQSFLLFDTKRRRTGARRHERRQQNHSNTS